MGATEAELHIYQWGWILSHARECEICLAYAFVAQHFSSWLKYWAVPGIYFPDL